VYQAANKQVAEDALLDLEEKWGKQYPVVIASWQNNWEKLSEYFKYDQGIRKIIYTTAAAAANAVEGYHRQVRKVTKTKGVFPSDMALLKLIYLASKNISKKWVQPMQNWGQILQQLAIHFEGRVPLGLW
ncbi:transposase, partial [Flexithrix dorotheae]|uniref:transposase n=1 Tax=Flexithrix dorotheae TaxID=70993 RepID=UPI00037CD4F0